MSINIGSIARGIQNQVNDLNIDSRIKNVANITVQNLAKAQDLLSVATGPFAGLKAARSIMNPRAAFPTPATSFSPTSVSNASRTLAAGARTALPESQVDGTITTYPGASSTPKVYLINGIATDQAGRDSIGLATAAQTGRNVNLINNSTEGAVKDLLECVEQLIFGKASKPSQKLADEIVNNLTKNPPEKMDLIGFSQGTIMVTHGVSLAINRLKNMGYSDDQIKSMMSQNVTVKLVGTPVDVTNPMQTILNVPPGLSGVVGGKRLDWYFTMEDRVISGKNIPYDEKFTLQEQGRPGELSKPNFQLIRHNKDAVATVVRDFGPDDVALLAASPTLFFLTTGAKIAFTVGGSLLDGKGAFGYHDYNNVYLNYMKNENVL